MYVMHKERVTTHSEMKSLDIVIGEEDWNCKTATANYVRLKGRYNKHPLFRY
jgi:hypothetical protein